MPPFVRRQSPVERIKAYLNPLDILLWLSEELESHGWDQLEKEWAIPIGIGLNLVFLVARANSKVRPRHYNDVFGDEVAGISWLAWLVSLQRWMLEEGTGRRSQLFGTGFIHCPFPDPPIGCQYNLYLWEEEALPTLRSIS